MLLNKSQKITCHPEPVAPKLRSERQAKLSLTETLRSAILILLY